jgi:ferritin
MAEDIKSSIAYTILVELEREGRLATNKVDALKQKFAKLHDVVVTCFENEKSLMSKATELK